MKSEESENYQVTEGKLRSVAEALTGHYKKTQVQDEMQLARITNNMKCLHKASF